MRQIRIIIVKNIFFFHVKGSILYQNTVDAAIRLMNAPEFIHGHLSDISQKGTDHGSVAHHQNIFHGWILFQWKNFIFQKIFNTCINIRKIIAGLIRYMDGLEKQ